MKLNVPQQRDANAGGYLCTVTNDAGEVIATQWHDSPEAAQAWFNAAYGEGPGEYVPPKTKEEAEALEARGGSPSSLTWPPRPPVMETPPPAPEPEAPPPPPVDDPEEAPPAKPLTEEAPPAGGVFPESKTRTGGKGKKG